MVSFTACAAGYEYTYSSLNAQESRNCVECDAGYYSIGWNYHCEECSYIDRASLSYYYETNIIDTSCFEDDILIETVRGLYSGDGATITVVLLILIVIIATFVVIGYYLCKKDKCCMCFHNTCGFCIPKAFRKDEISKTTAGN